MTLAEFKRDYSHNTGGVTLSQLLVDELDHREVELRKRAQEYLTAARVLHKTAFALGLDIFK